MKHYFIYKYVCVCIKILARFSFKASFFLILTQWFKYRYQPNMYRYETTNFYIISTTHAERAILIVTSEFILACNWRPYRLTQDCSMLHYELKQLVCRHANINHAACEEHDVSSITLYCHYVTHKLRKMQILFARQSKVILLALSSSSARLICWFKRKMKNYHYWLDLLAVW